MSKNNYTTIVLNFLSNDETVKENMYSLVDSSVSEVADYLEAYTWSIVAEQCEELSPEILELLDYVIGYEVDWYRIAAIMLDECIDSMKD